MVEKRWKGALTNLDYHQIQCYSFFLNESVFIAQKCNIVSPSEILIWLNFLKGFSSSLYFILLKVF